ncbi:MAG TPA: hypothetical protein VHS97_19085, partial [Isosphaeraceae bacterium]|nr:hypothetical protein [Isosphaeraceae bacterium]
MRRALMPLGTFEPSSVPPLTPGSTGSTVERRVGVRVFLAQTIPRRQKPVGRLSIGSVQERSLMTMDGRPGRREPGMVLTGRINAEAVESTAAVVGAPVPARAVGVPESAFIPPTRSRSTSLRCTLEVIGRACAIAVIVCLVVSARARAQDKFPDGPISKIEFEG